MSEELQQPPVVDLEGLLQPISEDAPSGESLRYSGVYDEITEARRADKDLNQGAWQTELKVADYRKVIDIAVPALRSKTKDLQICAWLAEALIKQYGFAGLRDSLKLLAGIQEMYWDTLHPEIDEGDMGGRANAISWFDAQASIAVMGVPFTGSAGYSYLDWEDSKVYDLPDNLESLPSADQTRLTEQKAAAEAKGKVTGDAWRREIVETRRASCEVVNFTVDECWAELRNLNRVIEEKYDRNQMPGLSTLQKSLDTVHTQIKKLLDQKRAEEPDPIEIEEPAEVGADGVAGSVATASGSPTGAIQSRRDALKRLADIADYFQKTEPHSPLSYLINRAVKWGNMPLESWLKDVIKDESVLSQIHQTLGFNTNNGDDTGNQ